MSAYNRGRHGEAFQHFSEAIRLSPGNCIYHANRASAALHLGRADVALQDAKYVPWLQLSELSQHRWNYTVWVVAKEDQSLYIMKSGDQEAIPHTAAKEAEWYCASRNAVKRGAGYCKAYLRGGAAAMALQRPHEALSMYQQALQLNPGSRAAKVHSSLAQLYQHSPALEPDKGFI